MMWLLIALLACGPKNPAKDVDVDTDVNTDTDAPIQDDACDELPEGQVSLPADEAPHDEAVEWWYWTGHLQDDAGRRYGFEEVFFGMDFGVYRSTSAHIAVADLDADRFDYDIAYLSGGALTPSVDGFSHSVKGNTAQGSGGHDQLHGETASYVLDLELNAVKAPVLQHGDGYHDYDVGGYTWYYSRERMEVQGTLQVDGESRTVSGSGWMDHQWGDLALQSSTGWDWFAIQLDDDREVMLFLTHGGDGVIGGSITDAGCHSRELGADEIVVNELGSWTSPTSGCTYPSGWELEIAGERWVVAPFQQDNELVNPYQTYWEGPASVSGDARGSAYVELAGYCQ